MLSRDEILMGRDVQYPLTPELEGNLTKLLATLNKFRSIYGKPMVVSSGYRPGPFNIAAKGAKRSNHMVCLACDFKDIGNMLDEYCLNNQLILEECGLWLESPRSTPGWSHLQCIQPTSGKRVFEP